MSHRLSRPRRALLLATALAALCAAMALPSASASATPFCNGAVVNNTSSCTGAARAFQFESGYGDTTSICIGIEPAFLGGCSGGPGEIVSQNWGSRAVRSPYLRGNAATFTTAHGETS